MATPEPGLLTSPEYPSDYPLNIYSCDTIINAGTGQAVLLNFEVFQIHTRYWVTEYCAWDYLEVSSIETPGVTQKSDVGEIHTCAYVCARALI